MIKFRVAFAFVSLVIVGGCAAATDPCAGKGLDQSAYYQCRSYHEQVRINRINTFNQIYSNSQQAAPVYRRPTQTNCQTDSYGNISCQNY